MGDETKESPAEALANCLLAQYKLCASGLAIGVAYSLKTKKGIIPVVGLGVAGTMADLVYGYTVECKRQVQEYDNSK